MTVFLDWCSTFAKNPTVTERCLLPTNCGPQTMELDFLIDPPPREVSGTARGLQPHAERWSPFLAEHARNCMIDRIVYIEPTSLRVSITSFPSPLRSELGSTQGSQLGKLLFDFEYSLHIVFIAFLPAGRIPLHQMAWTGLRLVHFGARGHG